MPDGGRGADLPLQGVWSGTDQLFYLPLQGGLRDCTQTHTDTHRYANGSMCEGTRGTCAVKVIPG